MIVLYINLKRKQKYGFREKIGKSDVGVVFGIFREFYHQPFWVKNSKFYFTHGEYFIFLGIYSLIGFFANLCFDPHSAHNPTYKRSDPINKLSVEDEK